MSHQTKITIAGKGKPKPVTLFSLFQNRHEEDELMDLPTTSRKDFTEALYDIQWVNTNLGGTEALLEELVQFMSAVDDTGTFSILDLGTGSGDIPCAIARWARDQSPAHPVKIHITAIDIHPVAVDVARQMGQEYPEIRFIQGDALHLDFADDTFDVVISSMFMHHLHSDDTVRLLKEMARLSRRGLIVNDLERHPLAWLGIKALGFFQGKGKIFQNDAPLSVLRGFTRQELTILKDAAGLPDMEIHHRRPYRWILSWKKSHQILKSLYRPEESFTNN